MFTAEEEADVECGTQEETEEDEVGKEVTDPEQQRLRDIISSTLTTHLKQLKVSSDVIITS